MQNDWTGLFEIVNDTLSFRYYAGGERKPYEEHETDWRTPPFLVIVYVQKGRYYYQMKNEARNYIDEGCAMLIPANITHLVGLDGEGILNFAHVHYVFAQHLDLLGLYNVPAVTDAVHGAEIAEIVDGLSRVHHCGHFSCREIAASKALGFKLLQSILDISFFKESDNFNFLKIKRISAVLEYMRDHMAESIDRKTLAALLSLSESRFHFLFKEAMGLPPIDYLRKIRISRAQELLLTTGRSINEIAIEAGFKNTFYFSKAFKDQMGLSPSEYRRRNA